jgi:acyl-CoA:acyl-CoA alkyltransferase
MNYTRVNLSSFGTLIPPVVVTSEEIETRLAPLYERLHLPEGRLELMTGIRERRFWETGMLPSDAATGAARALLDKYQLSPDAIQALIFCGVSHDFSEPATSTAVVRKLNLKKDTLNFDISNACLGMVSGIMTLANMVELGQIECGIAVTGENARPLVENTISALNDDMTITRRNVKDQFASLTIGCAATAVLVTRQGFLPATHSHALCAVATASDCSNNALCQGTAEGAMTDGTRVLMKTDSHELMVQGIEVAARMWNSLRNSSNWGENILPDIVCGHQVGKVHRDLLFEKLGLPVALDFPVFPEFGNCGSASLPLACCLAEERGCLQHGMRLAALGIGSGINAAGMIVKW